MTKLISKYSKRDKTEGINEIETIDNESSRGV